jgi:N-methylhydantoinase A
LRVAIDTGGTFTDCVTLRDGEIEVLKVASTPADPSLAVLQAVVRIGAGDALALRHGTTVGTNTMLERKGARVAFVTTEGFEDTIAIGRQTRASLYDWLAPVPQCLVPKALRFGVPERVSAEREMLRRPSDVELATLFEQVRGSGAESIAVSLLFSFANPETEQRVEACLRALGVPISVSHRILPEFREYERAATTVVNAYLAPRMESYLLGLESSVAHRYRGARVDVMQSSGGTIPVRLAAEEPVRTILSGPAGGVIGATRMATTAGFQRIIGCDMGGTSTDVFLADAGSGGVQRTRESVVAGVPVSVPMLDIHTVGAGGGSIARFDAGGILRVGPQSAGADPGPICLGRGTEPTVTDANLLLGRLDVESFVDGIALDRERAARILAERKDSLTSVEAFAAGILRVIEAEMEKAIRVISVERGYDPREFTLVAFGGGGPLHACALARALRMPTVLVPKMPGALSAIGILLADTVRDFSRTVMLPGTAIDALGEFFAELEQRGAAEFAADGVEGVAECSLDLRYRGQGYELNVPLRREVPGESMVAFHALHRQRYGFADSNKPVEIVNLRLRMVAAGEAYSPSYTEPVPGDGSAACLAKRKMYFDGGFVQAKIYRRDALRPGDCMSGPAMITEYTSATLLPPDYRAEVDGYGNLVIHIPQHVAQGGA